MWWIEMKTRLMPCDTKCDAPRDDINIKANQKERRGKHLRSNATIRSSEGYRGHGSDDDRRLVGTKLGSEFSKANTTYAD